jgi:hypothetical protein
MKNKTEISPAQMAIGAGATFLALTVIAVINPNFAVGLSLSALALIALRLLFSKK